MPIKIKKATEEYIKDLQNLSRELFEHDLPYDKFLFKEWSHTEFGYKYFLKAVTLINHCAFIAIDDNKVVGYLIGYIWDTHEARPIKTAELDNLIISENVRGKGVGKLLLETFKTWCKEQDVKDMVVMAYSQNTEALKFYKREGFGDLAVRLHQELKYQ